MKISLKAIDTIVINAILMETVIGEGRNRVTFRICKQNRLI